jgi:TolB protein
VVPSLDVCGIYITRADGSQPQRVADGCGRPAWSPDGTALAFSAANTGTLYVVNADGSNLRPLFAFGPGRQVSDPTWSPDGTKLAFDGWWQDSPGGTHCIFVINANGSGAVCLGDTERSSTPAWSPDGSQLAVGRSDSLGSDIWLINPDGSGATNLTQGKGAFAFVRAPAWSPDGSRLVFEGEVEGYEIFGLFVINRDGTGLQQLDTDGRSASSPTWRRVAPPAAARALTGARRGWER